MDALLPSFVLQPLVENAIKYGISRLLIPGVIRIRAYQKDNGMVYIDIEDNAGQYHPVLSATKGVGMKNVDERIKALYGRQYGLKVDCSPNQYTIVTITMPFKSQL